MSYIWRKLFGKKPTSPQGTTSPEAAYPPVEETEAPWGTYSPIERTQSPIERTQSPTERTTSPTERTTSLLQLYCSEALDGLVNKNFSEKSIRDFIGTLSKEECTQAGYLIDELRSLIIKQKNIVKQEIRNNVRVSEKDAIALINLLYEPYHKLSPDLRMTREAIFQRYPVWITREDLPNI